MIGVDTCEVSLIITVICNNQCKYCIAITVCITYAAIIIVYLVHTVALSISDCTN